MIYVYLITINNKFNNKYYNIIIIIIITILFLSILTDHHILQTSPKNKIVSLRLYFMPILFLFKKTQLTRHQISQLLLAREIYEGFQIFNNDHTMGHYIS